MVVGHDVAVRRHEHARSQARFVAVAVAEHVAGIAAEEVLEERIVGEGRGRAAVHLERRDVGDGPHRLGGHGGEIGRGARRERGGALAGRRRLLQVLDVRDHLVSFRDAAREHEAGDEARGDQEQREARVV